MTQTSANTSADRWTTPSELNRTEEDWERIEKAERECDEAWDNWRKRQEEDEE